MNCEACSKELKGDRWSSETDYQFENALWLGFFGGYGMFTDGGESKKFPGSSAEAVICHECAHVLCEANPWINKLLKPKLSHSHTQEFWAANPHHEGWDKRDDSTSPEERIAKLRKEYDD